MIALFKKEPLGGKEVAVQPPAPPPPPMQPAYGQVQPPLPPQGWGAPAAPHIQPMVRATQSTPCICVQRMWHACSLSIGQSW